MSKVSIVIPIYNVEKFLSTCLDSVLSQTYSNIEIILVNDATPDRSGLIANEYATLDERITVIHKTKNEGLNMARSTGYSASTGDFVTFIDSDDKVLPEYIEVLLQAQRKTSADVTMCGYTFYDAQLEKLLIPQPIPQHPVKDLPDTYNQDQMIYYYLTQWQYWTHNNNTTTTCCKLFTREVLSYVDWSECDYNVGEDDFETLYTLAHGRKFAVVNNQLYLYRANPNSISNSKKFTPKYRGKNISAFDMCRDFEKKALKLLGYRYRNEIFFRLHIIYTHYINLLLYKDSLSLEDAISFNKNFPLKEVKKIKEHPVDNEMLELLNDGGLIRYLEFKHPVRNVRQPNLKELLDVTQEKNKELERREKRNWHVPGIDFLLRLIHRN